MDLRSSKRTWSHLDNLDLAYMMLARTYAVDLRTCSVLTLLYLPYLNSLDLGHAPL